MDESTFVRLDHAYPHMNKSLDGRSEIAGDFTYQSMPSKPIPYPYYIESALQDFRSREERNEGKMNYIEKELTQIREKDLNGIKDALTTIVQNGTKPGATKGKPVALFTQNQGDCYNPFWSDPSNVNLVRLVLIVTVITLIIVMFAIVIAIVLGIVKATRK